MNYNFEWDPDKAKKNQIKHKISFERSATIFNDPNTLSIYDNEHSINEDRWISLGIDNGGVLIVVCHTFVQIDDNNISIRIISARKANKKEINQYKELPL